MLGASSTAIKDLVRMTTLWRGMFYCLMVRPIIPSDLPFEYTFAVSHVFRSWSNAALMIGNAFSSIIYGVHRWSPNDTASKIGTETLSPPLLSCVYSASEFSVEILTDPGNAAMSTLLSKDCDLS